MSDFNKPARVFWSFRQVCTQDAGGGGYLTVYVTPAAGSMMKIINATHAASGNRAVTQYLCNADVVTMVVLNTIAAVAAATCVIPTPGSAAGVTNGNIATIGLEICAPSFYAGIVTAAAVTETATCMINAELFGTRTAPTVSWAGSGGTPSPIAATENTITIVPGEY